MCQGLEACLRRSLGRFLLYHFLLEMWRWFINKKKTQSSSNQQFTNTYGWQSAPISSEMQGVIDMANQPVAADPSIQHRYASMEEDVRRSTQDPFGAATSPDVRAKSQLSRILTVQRDRDKAMREGELDRQNLQFGRKTAAAALTMPQLVQTGGNSSGTQNTTQSGGFWASVVPGVASGAMAAF